MAENLTSAEMQEKLTEFLQKVMVQPMARRFDFASQKGTYPPTIYKNTANL